MAGLPGTGKTTLAYAIGRMLHWPVLDKDLLNTVLLNALLDQAQAGPLAYDLLLNLGHDLVVHQQQSIILDTAGRQSFILERAKAITHQAHARLKVIYCVAPHTVRAERLTNRIARPSQWIADHATDSEQEHWYAHLPPETLVVSSVQPLEDTLSTALLFLQSDG
jgi:predicted kinase